jgi:hypothetical protein
LVVVEVALPELVEVELERLAILLLYLPHKEIAEVVVLLLAHIHQVVEEEQLRLGQLVPVRKQERVEMVQLHQ